MKAMMKRFFFASLLLLLTAVSLPAKGQIVMDRKVRFGIILEGDTIPYYRLKEVKVLESASLLTETEIRKNQKLIRNVKKMLPYAKIGKQRLDVLEKEIADLPDKETTMRAQWEGQKSLADKLQGCGEESVG